MYDPDQGLVESLVGDGRPLLSVTALALIVSGCFAIFISSLGQFLPHDLDFLGPSAGHLATLADGRVAYFMFHDRVAFGGALIAVGVLYLWLVHFPLAEGELWAWRALLVSGALGFGSFLTYLGYGYLDTWHGAATLGLLPLFVWGLVKSRGFCTAKSMHRPSFASWGSRARLGRALLLLTGLGMVMAGLTIMVVGMTSVFVPQDLTYMKVTPQELHSESAHLIPLIAHDRAGFGGAIATCGVLVVCCVWYGRRSKSLWQALAIAGCTGFGAAIGVHFVIGYADFTHLAPAFVGLAIYLVGLIAVVVTGVDTGRETASRLAS